MRQVLKWNEEARVIRGYIRCCIYDLKRKEYELVPLETLKLIKLIEAKELRECFDIIHKEDRDWIFFFLSKEYLLEIPSIVYENFIPLSLEWDSPFLINNAIIHCNNDFTLIKKILSYAICKHIQLVCESKDRLISILENDIKGSNFHSVEVIIEEELSKSEIDQLLSKYIILTNVFIKKKSINFSENKFFTPFFFNNIDFFTESQSWNLFYNRKLIINNNGNIISSYDEKFILGSIVDIKTKKDLLNLINNKYFNDKWSISKDKCSVCKDCEFRYMCFDNRLPLLSIEKNYYFEIECSYNPYIAKWEGEEGYRTLAECGVISNEEGFSIDHEKIAEINRELWGEDVVN